MLGMAGAPQVIQEPFHGEVQKQLVEGPPSTRTRSSRRARTDAAMLTIGFLVIPWPRDRGDHVLDQTQPCVVQHLGWPHPSCRIASYRASRATSRPILLRNSETLRNGLGQVEDTNRHAIHLDLIDTSGHRRAREVVAPQRRMARAESTGPTWERDVYVLRDLGSRLVAHQSRIPKARPDRQGQNRGDSPLG